MTQKPDLFGCPFCGVGRIKHTESDDPQFYFECSDEKCISFVINAESEQHAFDIINKRAVKPVSLCADVVRVLKLAQEALKRTHIHASKDGVWINSRVNGSAMWGMQGVQAEVIKSFELSAALNHEALTAIEDTLSVIKVNNHDR